MSRLDSRSSRDWLLALALTGALAFGMAACGDSDDDTDADAGQPSATTSADTSTAPDTKAKAPADDGGRRARKADEPDGGRRAGNADSGAASAGGVVEVPADVSADERPVTDAVVGMYQAFAAGDAAGVCEHLSDGARQQVAKTAPGARGASDQAACVASFKAFLREAKRGGLRRDVKIKVIQAEIGGDSAAVTVRVSGKTGDVNLVKDDDGDWGFAAPPGS